MYSLVGFQKYTPIINILRLGNSSRILYSRIRRPAASCAGLSRYITPNWSQKSIVTPIRKMSQAPGPGNQFTRQRSERSAPTNRDQDDLDQSFEQMIAPESSKPTKTTRINGDQVEVLEVDHHLGAHIQGVMAQEQMLAGDSQFFNICDDPLSATISRVNILVLAMTFKLVTYILVQSHNIFFSDIYHFWLNSDS